MPNLLDRLKTALADLYAIKEELGAGGMATVYLAEDLKHHRKVAVKVLRPELAAILGAERFLKEIEVTANLQHPNILPLYDSGEADTFLYYVMPYIEGETLRDKLNSEKQLGVEETVEIARSVAGALSFAHARGVIHRDIKPANILLQSGQALVADFGIALAVSQAGGTRLTETGLSLGTPQYMSPEQAMGDRELDARSDVYSLGATVYEMLVGDPPHIGGSAQAIVAKILSEKPSPITQSRDFVPANVDAAVQKALAKSPADRFTKVEQFAEALTNPAFTLPTTQAAAVAGAPASGPWNRVSIATTALAMLLAVVAVWGWLRPEPPRTVARYGIALPPDQELVDDFHPTFALAPDASWIVYVGPGLGDDQLWVKPRNEYRATPIRGTEGARGPVVSPDGQWIAFIVDGQLRKVPVGGGSAITLTDSVQTGLRSAAWLDDGTLVYTDLSWRLRRLPDVGGPSEVVFTPDMGLGLGAYLPTAIPGGRGVLFTVCRVGSQCRAREEAWVLDLRTGEARMLMSDIARSWYVATGHLVYVRPDGSVFAVPFDLGSLEMRGAPVPILEGVQVERGTSPDFALSETGALLMVAGLGLGQGGEAQVVSVDRSGDATPVDQDWTFLPAAYQGIAVSPDGTRLAVNVAEEIGEDIWVKQLDGGPVSRVTFHDAQDSRPRWTPDGQSLMFISQRAGAMDLYVKPADGTGSAEILLDLDPDINEGVWSPDGTWLVIRTGGLASGVEGDRDIWGIRPGIDSVPLPLVADEWDEKALALSPDGKWLAYESNESGTEEVYVRPFPDTEAGKWQVSTNGGTGPVWAHSGRELFYVKPPPGGRTMMVAAVETEPTFSVGERRALFPLGGEYWLSAQYAAYDVAPDDEHFFLVRSRAPDDERGTGGLIIVDNWFEELKAKVGN